MQKKLNIKRLSIMFPLALVLFEFTVYLGNDLIQPAMLAITAQFNIDSTWAASSMSAYILGGASVACILGPLSDKYGRKKILLLGVCIFIITNIIIMFSSTMHEFLVWRFLQGTGLSFISSVGYAAIQESFEERQAVKVMALMANVSIIAPLVGPVLGTILIEHIHWHWGFIAIVILSCISGLGLKKYMLSKPPVNPSISFKNILSGYKNVIANKLFLTLAISLPMIGLPLLLWIAFSPIIIVNFFGLSGLDYGMLQIPILGSLMLGNVVLFKIINKLELGESILIGLPIMMFGACLLLLAVFISQHALLLMTLGMMLIAFGEGLSFSVIYRFTLMSSSVSKGVVASAISIIISFFFFTIIEIARMAYEKYELNAFLIISFFLILIWFTYPRLAIKKVMASRKNTIKDIKKESITMH